MRIAPSAFLASREHIEEPDILGYVGTIDIQGPGAVTGARRQIAIDVNSVEA